MISLQDASEEVRMLLLAYRKGNFTDSSLLEKATNLIVATRIDHFKKSDGKPDVRGASWAYRQWMGKIYDQVATDQKDRIAWGNRIRWHVGQAIREQLTPSQLISFELQLSNLKERGEDRRARRSEKLDLVKPGVGYLGSELKDVFGLLNTLIGRLEQTSLSHLSTAKSRSSLGKLSKRLSKVASSTTQNLR